MIQIKRRLWVQRIAVIVQRMYVAAEDRFEMYEGYS
jgi:hypothetical protein